MVAIVILNIIINEASDSGDDHDSHDESHDDNWEQIYDKVRYDKDGIVGWKFTTYGGGPAGGYIQDLENSVLYTWHQE